MIANIFDYKAFEDSIEGEFLGNGAEGYACLVGNKVIKVFFRNKLIKMNDRKIITTDDFNLDTFVFPDTLFVWNDRYVGYKCRYIPNDIFLSKKRLLLEKDIYNILKSREKMLKEAEELSKSNIAIADLAYNLLFDGTNLAAIDTTNYKECNYETYNRNIELVDGAILQAIQSNSVGFGINGEMSFDENIKEYQKVLKRIR